VTLPTGSGAAVGSASAAATAAMAAVVDVARSGKLYPAVILHGGDEPARRRAAVELARCLLCEREPAQRPCGECRHCRRVAAGGAGTGSAGDGDSQPGSKSLRPGPFHPDLLWLEKDLKTSVSADAARTFLQAAQLSPFEARGQVFVVANAESLTPEAANALLKVLEEPPVRAPRHFLLLAPSRLDLLATLRSRSLSVFLGPSVGVDESRVTAAAARLAECVTAHRRDGSPVHLLTAATELLGGGFEDPRSMAGWAQAAAIAHAALDQVAVADRRAVLELAHDLLQGVELRLRGIPAERIVEGAVSRRLARLGPPT
jgi:hypothetical protein